MPKRYRVKLPITKRTRDAFWLAFQREPTDDAIRKIIVSEVLFDILADIEVRMIRKIDPAALDPLGNDGPVSYYAPERI